MMNQKKINITFPKPYPKQAEVIRACLSNDYKGVVLNGSRQTGKSFLLALIAVYWALNCKSENIMVVSPTDSQVKKLYKDVCTMIAPAEMMVKSKKAQSGDCEIIFENNSVIMFRSAGSEDSLRGYSLTHLLLDECAYIKEDTWNLVLEPTLTVRGKKALFVSTPKGNNFFRKIYQKGLDREGGYISFTINYRDNPFADIEFINERKQTLAREIFEQEYEGKFIDSSGVFSNVEELSKLRKVDINTFRANGMNSPECVIGVDIAFKKDYTVAVCLSTDGKMLDYIRFNQTDTNTLVTRLYDFINMWKPRKTIIEENNQGLPVYHLLREKGIYNFESFVTTNKSKSEIINPLIAAFNKKEIYLLNDDVVKDEFEAFSYTMTKHGNVTFQASYGHDDIVMATAFAWKAKGLSSYTPMGIM